MNSVVRQLLEQDTDVVMVDTGDSYEGICDYFQGTYISYSKEHPISMNPFKVTSIEYNENFGEKKNFLKNLIFLIFKGNDAPTKIEDAIIDKTLSEYYQEYFKPFEAFTPQEKADLRDRLLKEAAMEEEYEDYLQRKEDIDREIQQPPSVKETPGEPTTTLSRPSEERRSKLLRQCRALNAIIKDLVDDKN